MVKEGQIWVFCDKCRYVVGEFKLDTCVLYHEDGKLASSAYELRHFSNDYIWTPLTMENE